MLHYIFFSFTLLSLSFKRFLPCPSYIHIVFYLALLLKDSFSLQRSFRFLKIYRKYIHFTYRPFHKTLPRSSAFVNWISVRFYETDCSTSNTFKDFNLFRFSTSDSSIFLRLLFQKDVQPKLND